MLLALDGSHLAVLGDAHGHVEAFSVCGPVWLCDLNQVNPIPERFISSLCEYSFSSATGISLEDEEYLAKTLLDDLMLPLGYETRDLIPKRSASRDQRAMSSGNPSYVVVGDSTGQLSLLTLNGNIAFSITIRSDIPITAVSVCMNLFNHSPCVQRQYYLCIFCLIP